MTPSHYVSPWWLPSGHLQTIYPAKCTAKPAVNYRRERWTTPDNDFIDVDFVDGLPDQPIVVLFHGLEGSSDSHYARALMHAVSLRGWTGIVPHFRSCSGEMNLAPRFYFSGDSVELSWMMQKIQQHQATIHASHLFATGVSLGGNTLLKWLGEHPQSSGVDAACAISAPIDMAASGRALGKSRNQIYAKVFLKTMQKKAIEKWHQFPDLFDLEAILAAKDIYTFDNLITAPLHGFMNVEDYWYHASSKHVLMNITVPTWILNAQNDPFMPKVCLPKEAAPSVTLSFPKHGGHVGFPTGPFPGHISWLPEQMLAFLSQAIPDHSNIITPDTCCHTE